MRLITKLRQFKSIYNQVVADIAFQYRYSLSDLTSDNIDNRLARIMLLIHQLEKGLSHEVRRSDWGKEKAYRLVGYLKALDSEMMQHDVVQTAISVLQKYKNDDAACKDALLLRDIDFLLEFRKSGTESWTGFKTVTEPDFKKSENTIWYFFKTRGSVREFSNRRISDEDFKLALDFASLTPTACNRQTSRVYKFEDKEIIKQILDTQLGDQGWCMNASTLFVVVSNGSFFDVNMESRQAYIDGGMYAMNFCMGLHLQHIATCFKMFVRSRREEKEFRKITGIKPQEIPIVCILAGYYPEDGHAVPAPLSHRLALRYFGIQ